MHEHCILADVPVVGGEHILTALVQNGVECAIRYVEGHGIGAGVEVHLVQVLEVIEIRQDAARGGVVLEVIEHAVDLIEQALLVLVLHTELVAVGFADGACFIRPGIPDVGGKVMDVVRLLLPDPEKLVHRAFEIGAAERENGKFLLQVVAVDKTELFDRVGGGAVGPVRTNGEVIVAHAALQNVETVGAEDLIGVAHGSLLTSFRSPRRGWRQAPTRAWGRRWDSRGGKCRTRGAAPCSRG